MQKGRWILQISEKQNESCTNKHPSCMTVQTGRNETEQTVSLDTKLRGDDSTAQYHGRRCERGPFIYSIMYAADEI
jgi:hypothetical protein